MGHWAYEFSGCPDSADYQQIADDAEPGDVVLRECPDGLGIVDGFVRESVDDMMMVARFRWVASVDPSAVAPAVLQASGLLPLARRDAWLVRTGSELDAGESA
ncbi:hypothetical protein OHA79_43685 [Streptomyces sp. NBC_00841]|uniref:hypothetical protein n=1 Tax=unclassified Streptomyces TaxID=2593676 RepID=UPI0022567CDA|nr:MULTISPECIES: hypothetical protein [unclassified Streptomyces]MCX4530135.1 hypothetical protein [Streptomyces sp. NBC_01669]WSA04080.1 hypothetical protein OHA79_43685 [Streptomyces sp. NBC_00841]